MSHFDRDPWVPGYVDVTIVEFAAHTAYLDPRSGTGYLVTPRPETDVAAPEDPLVQAVWSDSLHDPGRVGGLSLNSADRQEAFDYLRDEGWLPLLDDQGGIEPAGWTADGRQALCLYGTPTSGRPCLETLSRALMALDIAAGLGTRSRHC
ncbi:hypothetical protein [Kribbella sp. NPDC049227]|uniref:hypothetical protein n=1 Tax=Kribbella sp. NPDC049227 TaxID=3364113 RepID=UPI00371D24CB